MKKQDLAALLGISPSMVSRLSKQGMPTHSLEAAQQWRERYLDMARVKGFHPGRGSDEGAGQRAKLAAMREYVRSAGQTARLPVASWLALVDYCIGANGRQRLLAQVANPTPILVAALCALISGGAAGACASLWLYAACDWHNDAEAMAREEVEE